MEKIRYRVSIIKEISTTEQTYIKCLQDLDYYRTNFEKEHMLTENEDKQVFNDIGSIITTHQTLLNKLKDAKQTYASNLSSIFIDFSNYFKVSKQYIGQYSYIIQMFLEKRKNKEFARKFQEISNNHVEMNSLLITPVQRMPRYILFLRDLIKYTPPSHPDASLLKMAEKVIQDVTSDIEKASAEAENQALIYSIQDKIGTDQLVLIQPDRVCLLNLKVTFTNNRVGMIYLFNDLVLIISDNEQSAKIVLAKTPIEFKYSVPSYDTIEIMAEGNKKEERKVERTYYH